MYFRRALIGCCAVLFALGCSGGGGAEVKVDMPPMSPEAQQARELMMQTQQEMLQRQKEMMERSVGAPTAPNAQGGGQAPQ